MLQISTMTVLYELTEHHSLLLERHFPVISKVQLLIEYLTAGYEMTSASQE